jgi:hypothetical protein
MENKTVKYVLFNALGALLLLVLVGSFVLAADISPMNTAPISSVLINLQKAGYVAVQSVEFKNNAYDAQAINAQGKQIDVQLNNQAIIVSPIGSPNAKVTMLSALKAVKQAGYMTVYAIEANDMTYSVQALNNNGKKVDLIVDEITGAVTQD